MQISIFVQVVGFRDVERHALNTVFRLSWDRETSYFLWTPEAPIPAQLALIDVDSYEGAMALASPEFNPNLKMICVGERAPATSWRVFPRPLQWPVVVAAMDELFTPVSPVRPGQSSLPPGIKVSLLVDALRENRLYLRARLALAGLTAVDDAENSAEGLALAKSRGYDLVIVNIDPQSQSDWELIDQMVALKSESESKIGAVVITVDQLAGQVREHAERAERVGCRGALAIPFEPLQIIDILQKT